MEGWDSWLLSCRGSQIAVYRNWHRMAKCLLPNAPLLGSMDISQSSNHRCIQTVAIGLTNICHCQFQKLPLPMPTIGTAHANSCHCTCQQLRAYLAWFFTSSVRAVPSMRSVLAFDENPDEVNEEEKEESLENDFLPVWLFSCFWSKCSRRDPS